MIIPRYNVETCYVISWYFWVKTFLQLSFFVQNCFFFHHWPLTSWGWRLFLFFLKRIDLKKNLSSKSCSSSSIHFLNKLWPHRGEHENPVASGWQQPACHQPMAAFEQMTSRLHEKASSLKSADELFGFALIEVLFQSKMTGLWGAAVESAASSAASRLCRLVAPWRFCAWQRQAFSASVPFVLMDFASRPSWLAERRTSARTQMGGNIKRPTIRRHAKRLAQLAQTDISDCNPSVNVDTELTAFHRQGVSTLTQRGGCVLAKPVRKTGLAKEEKTSALKLMLGPKATGATCSLWQNCYCDKMLTTTTVTLAQMERIS